MTARLPLLGLALLAPALLFASDDEADLILHDLSQGPDLRFHLGLAEGLDRLTLRDVNGGGDETRNFDGTTSFSADAEWLWSRLGYDRLGLVFGPGLAIGLHNGEDASGDEGRLLEVSGTYRLGLLMRWDNDDELASLRHVRFELTPVIGLGLARMELDGSDHSGKGLILRYGLLFETVADWRSGLTLSAGLGWMGGRSWLDWQNTDGSTVDLSGPTLRLGAGWHF
jgi:hypothetical protein